MTLLQAAVQTVQLQLRNYSLKRVDIIIQKGQKPSCGGVMLLIHKDIPLMPLSELVNDSESDWANIFANKTSNYVASWYRQPGGSGEEFQLFRDQLDYIRTKH